MQYLGKRAQPELGQALVSMIEALQILDEAGAPGHIGAHLDLAIAQLKDHISPPHGKSMPQIDLGSC